MPFDSENVKSCLIRAIKKEFPKMSIYKEKQQQGFKSPCFFVRYLDMEQEKETLAITKRTYLVNVRYMSSDSLTHIDEIADRLLHLLQSPQDDHVLLRARSLKCSVQEGVLQVFVEYDLRLKENKEKIPMKELQTKEGVKQ